MNRGAGTEYTADDESKSKAFRESERRVFLEELRAGDYRTPADRRRLALGWRFHAASLRRGCGVESSLANRLAGALDKGRAATAAVFRKIVEEEHAAALRAIEQLEGDA